MYSVAARPPSNPARSLFLPFLHQSSSLTLGTLFVCHEIRHKKIMEHGDRKSNHTSDLEHLTGALNSSLETILA